MKILLLLFLFLQNSFASERAPIISPIEGHFYWDDTKTFHDDPEEEICWGTNFEGVYCVHNLHIILTENAHDEKNPKDKNKCVLYIYDNVLEVIHNSSEIKKGDLVGYASSNEKAKPKIIKGC
jgi:hypothetical protein